MTSLGKDEAYHNPHMFDIMCGAYKALNDSHYTMTLVDISEDKVQGESVSRVISQKCADGLIIHGSAINKGIASLIVQKQFPHMIIGHPGFESQLCWVDTNHSLAGKYAAEHLLNRVQIQQLLNHRNHTLVIHWLNELTEQKYLYSFFKKELGNIPTVYYLGTKAKKILTGKDEIKEKILKRVYQEKKSSQAFKNHCICVAGIFISLALS